METTHFRDPGVSSMRFARNIQFQIKPGREKEFNTVFENEVVPTLKKQPGFEQELTLVNKEGSLGISIWQDRKSAETYQTATYPGILAKLNHLIEGTPQVNMYDVTTTTLPAVVPA
jgi:heme-degrading monooxygenase HmoA